MNLGAEVDLLFPEKNTTLVLLVVRLAELYDEAAVITLDRDFAVYRKNGRQVIPLISPFA